MPIAIIIWGGNLGYRGG